MDILRSLFQESVKIMDLIDYLVQINHLHLESAPISDHRMSCLKYIFK